MQPVIGRLGGRIVPVAVLKRVQRRWLRDKVAIHRDFDQFLRGRAATGIFRVYKDGSAAIFLRSDPTHYEVMRELLHDRHFKDIGPQLFSREPLLNREQYVYDALRTRYFYCIARLTDRNLFFHNRLRSSDPSPGRSSWSCDMRSGSRR